MEREFVIQEAIQNEADTVMIRGIMNPSKYVLRDGAWTYPVMSRYYGIEIIDADISD